MELYNDIDYPIDYVYFIRKKEKIMISIVNELKLKHYTCSITNENIDIIVDNFIFRCYLRLPSEINYMRKTLKNDFDAPHLRHFIHYYLYLPYHVSLIRSIESQHPSYGDTTRLVKIWLNIQMNSYDFSNELIDLLVAYIYIHPTSNLPPKNTFLGFIRFLSWMSTFSFQDTPIIFDNLSNFPIEDKQEIINQFNEFRKTHPNKCLIYIVTSFSKDYNWQSLLTRDYPRKEMLTRFILLCKSQSKLLENILVNPNYNDIIKSLFTVNYSTFDVVITCDENYCVPIPKYLRDIPIQNKKIKKSGKQYDMEIYPNLLESYLEKTLIDYNPIKLLIDELNEIYSYLGFFLYDDTFNNKICIIFKPFAFLPLPFKISESSETIPIESNGELKYTIPNILEIFNTIKELGKGLIISIKIQKSPLIM